MSVNQFGIPVVARNLGDIKSRRIFEDQSRNYQQALAGAQAAQEALASKKAEDKKKRLAKKEDQEEEGKEKESASLK